MSVGGVSKVAKTIVAFRVNMLENNDTYVNTLFLAGKQPHIEPMFKLSVLQLK